MGITNKTTPAQANAMFVKAKQRIETAIFMRLSRIGEELLDYAKSIPADKGYTDRTGNLRSSTGYVIVMNGKIAKSDFKKVSGSEVSKEDGENIGLTYAESLANNYSKGYVLIMVAGMEYALAVESRGKDVLTTTEIKAKAEIPVHLEQLRQNIKNMKL